MMPAMMPARSCSPPRVAETLLTSDTSKASGSAPYFSTLASSVALCWLKLPSIWARPPGIAALTDGAEMTTPSSTMANRFCGSPLAASARVASSKGAAPSALNSRSTTQATSLAGTPAEAVVSWSPSIRVGLSRYFSVPASSQANSGWSATSSTGVPQVNSANAAWHGLAGHPVDRLVRRGALAVGGQAGLARPAAVEPSAVPGSGLLLPVGLGSGTTLADAVGRGGGGSLDGAADSGRRRGGLGRGRGVTCSAAYTARKRSRAVWPTSSTSWSRCTFGTVTISCRSPAVVTSDSPTPRLSTRLWMICWASSRLFGSIAPVPLVFCAVSVMVVPPRRSRPSFGAQVLPTATSANSPAIRTASTIRVRPGCPVVVVATYVKSFADADQPAVVGRCPAPVAGGSRSSSTGRIGSGSTGSGPSGSTTSSTSRSASSTVAVLVALGDHPGDGLLEHRQLVARGDLQHDLLVAHRDDGAEHATAQHHPLAGREGGQRPLDFLLTFALGPHDQEVERDHHQGDQDQRAVLVHCSGVRLGSAFGRARGMT